MKNIFNKTVLLGCAILSFCNSNPTFGGEIKFGFEAKLDQDGISVNGKNIQDQTDSSYTRFGVTVVSAIFFGYIGSKFAELGKKFFIKDMGAFGGRIGAMFISALYRDKARIKTLAAQAVGEQIGAHLFETYETYMQNKVSQIGKITGASIAAALIEPNKDMKRYHLEKGLVKLATFQIIDKAISPKLRVQDNAPWIEIVKVPIADCLSTQLLKKIV